MTAIRSLLRSALDSLFICLFYVAFALYELWTFHKNDPVLHCAVYKCEGCAHVDGLLCDFPGCSMLKDFNEAL